MFKKGALMALGYQTFTVLPEHLKLLRRAFVRWNDESYDGSPEIDPKRPYGNSSVFRDIAEIIDPDGVPDPNENETAYERYEEEHYDKFMGFHQGTATTLQIILRTERFEPGVYRSEQYRDNWEYVGPADEAL